MNLRLDPNLISTDFDNARNSQMPFLILSYNIIISQNSSLSLELSLELSLLLFNSRDGVDRGARHIRSGRIVERMRGMYWLVVVRAVS